MQCSCPRMNKAQACCLLNFSFAQTEACAKTLCPNMTLGCAQQICGAVSRTSAAQILALHPMLMEWPAKPLAVFASKRAHCPSCFVMYPCYQTARRTTAAAYAA